MFVGSRFPALAFKCKKWSSLASTHGTLWWQMFSFKVLFRAHMKDSSFTMGRIWSYTRRALEHIACSNTWTQSTRPHNALHSPSNYLHSGSYIGDIMRQIMIFFICVELLRLIFTRSTAQLLDYWFCSSYASQWLVASYDGSGRLESELMTSCNEYA